MNFEAKIQSAIRAAELATTQANSLMAEYADKKDFTAIFLACCEKHGIKTVSINTYTELIESRKAWGKFCPDSAFADEREGTWPAIWVVCEEVGISGGCGNSGQHQIRSARLIDGVYKLENGQWTKLDDKDDEND